MKQTDVGLATDGEVKTVMAGFCQTARSIGAVSSGAICNGASGSSGGIS